jgi:hypothetical protein
MSKKVKIWLISGIVVVLIVLIYLFGIKRSGSYVTDNWIETYAPEDKGPYGTYVMKELLDTLGLFEDFIELDRDVEESLVDVEDENDIYFFIGKTNYITEDAIEKLEDFVYAGNTAFIAAEKMPDLLNDYFFLNTKKIYKIEKDSIQYFKFENEEIDSKKFKFEYIYNNRRELKAWQYFTENNFDLWGDNEAYILGRNTGNKANFIKISYGDGAFYLHSNPYAFTNVSMLKKDGFSYAENMLKHIPPGRVQWDKYNINYHYDSNSDGDGSGDGEDRRSILEFIFKSVPLTWAFIIFAFTALLYAIFKGKRMQDIVKPVILKENTSLRYIETISSLYLQEGKHGKLIRLKEKTFMNYIAEHYYLSSKNPDHKFIDKLTEKSQVNKDKITEIFTLFNKFRTHELVADDSLIELHRRIEYFYKNCK